MSIELKADGTWVFHGVDSRMKDPEKNAIPNYRIWNPVNQRFEYQTVYRCYCKNCGKECGISARYAVYVSYKCDKCAQFYDPDWRQMPPDEEFRWRNGLPPPGQDEKESE